MPARRNGSPCLQKCKAVHYQASKVVPERHTAVEVTYGTKLKNDR